MSPHQYLHASLLLLLQSRDTLVAAARAVTDGDTRLAILPDPTRGTYALRTLRCGERPRKTAVVTPTGAAATEAALDEALVAWVVGRLAALPRDNGAAPRTRGCVRRRPRGARGVDRRMPAAGAPERGRRARDWPRAATTPTRQARGA